MSLEDEDPAGPHRGPQRGEQAPIQEERIHDDVVLSARWTPSIEVRDDPADAPQTVPPCAPRRLPQGRPGDVHRVDLIACPGQVKCVAAEPGRDVERAPRRRLGQPAVQ